ncbi:DNA cytosine methyltransferase [Curtobacterium sp. SORGH_AS_0776]|uniref:DNA cytosine methyltransferase n=1 Tax=Curtobacterium sp. SORGH_AS_0776 TaxID=3041798 RepID=UPI00285BEABC|nr:DNA (cytosine-5)-methyltransferase 1 [Curtobacterium sp. SORGH_AS_0776]
MGKAPTVISLFSGAGGLDIGLEQAGWNISAATDFAPHAMETLRRSQDAAIPIAGRRSTYMSKTNLIEADVVDLSAADLRPHRAKPDWRPDLVVGGPPCQPWSSAGLQRGLDDPRGQLIAHYLRLIEELQPKFVIFENVRGLLTARGATHTPGEVLRSIQDDLWGIGYASKVTTLNAADFGAAQRRVRVILVATSDHTLPSFPTPTNDRFGRDGLPFWRSLGEALQELPVPDETDVVRPTGSRAGALRALQPGTGIKTAGKVMANRPSGHWGYRQDAFLADLSLPSRTIRAAGTPDWVRLANDTDLRRLTWRECAALQGFPTDWRFAGTRSQRFQQIGNAVQVNMAKAVGREVLQALRLGEAPQRPVSEDWSPTLLERVRYTIAEHHTNGHLRARQPDRIRAS